MQAERWRRIDALLGEALELPEEQRLPHLEKRCGGDVELRREIERLLAADRAATHFLTRPPLADLEAALADSAESFRGADLSPGTTVGRYRIEEKVGEGGMGAVYAAHDPELDRRVALKLVRLDEPAGRSRRRLLREAQALARVAHPNVVTVFDVGSHGDSVFLAMEYVPGGTLQEWLDERPRGWRAILAAFVAAGRGLAAAHAAAIVHRDFKPTNVLRDADGRLRVADFGVARTAPDDASAAGDPEARWTGARRSRRGALTASGWAVGTPSFMAPEQHTGDALGPATDQFAFCVALYQALYGVHPFPAGSPAESRARVLAGEMGPPPRGTPVPGWLRAALIRGLAVAPGDRWPSMTALLRQLEQRPGRRRVRSLTAAAAAVAAAALALWTSDDDAASRPRPAASVAVLPFSAPDGQPASAAIADGLTEALITALVRIEDLRVPARTSVYQLAGRGLARGDIAERLQVEHLLTGSVASSGGRLRVDARLLEAAGGTIVWSRTWNRRTDELFSVQEEIARAVVDGLAVEADDSPLLASGTESLRAYSLYLRGRAQWNQRTPDGLRRAARFFEQAIAEDPAFALAHSGLADAYGSMPAYDPAASPDALAKARAAALRAVELDPRSAEAQTSLAAVLMSSGEIEEAEERFRRAIALQPRYATAHHLYGYLLLHRLERPSAALAELELARQLDPSSSPIMALLAGGYHRAGRHERALATELELRNLDPEWRSGGSCLARSYLALGRWDEAVAAIAAEGGAAAAVCRDELVQAHHLRGDYRSELDVARRGLAERPDDLRMIEAQGSALAALGRIGEVRDLFARTLAAAGPDDPARYGLYDVLGELRVHGHAAAARELAGDLAAWHRRHRQVARPDGPQRFISSFGFVVALLEAGQPVDGAAEALAGWLAAAGPAERRRTRLSEHWLVGIEGWLAALRGQRDVATAHLRALAELEPKSDTPPFAAMTLAALGEREPALDALEERLQGGLVLNRELHVQVGLEPVRDLPRFRRLLAADGRGRPNRTEPGAGGGPTTRGRASTGS